jgi:hypothetical protein
MKNRYPSLTFVVAAVVFLFLFFAFAGRIASTDASAAAELHVCLAGPPTCDFNTIQAAVDAAQPGDMIKVAGGEYVGVQTRNNNTQHLFIDKSLTIVGGYNPPDWQNANPALYPVILNAQASGRVVYANGGINATLEGLRLSLGDAEGQGGGPWDDHAGGGLYADGASLVLDNCWLSGNIAQSGGGLYLKDGDLTLTDSLFTNNVADMTTQGSFGDGGGLFLNHCIATFERNRFLANSAGYGGSAIHTGFNSNLTMVNNVLAANQIEERPPYSWGCALVAGGSTVEMLHSTINGNLGGNGAGVCADSRPSASAVYLTNAVVVNQTVGVDVAAGSSATIDSVLWHANSGGNTSGAGSVSISHAYTGDPLFLGDGFHLTEESPAIDKGIDAGVSRDIDGQPRPQGSGPDLGADEWQPPATPTATPTVPPTPNLIYLPLVLKQPTS